MKIFSKLNRIELIVLCNAVSNPLFLMVIALICLMFALGIAAFIAYAFAHFLMVLSHYFGASVDFEGNDASRGWSFILNNIEDLIFKHASVLLVTFIGVYRGYEINLSMFELEIAAISTLIIRLLPEEAPFLRYKALYAQSIFGALSAYILYSVFWPILNV